MASTIYIFLFGLAVFGIILWNAADVSALKRRCARLEKTLDEHGIYAD